MSKFYEIDQANDLVKARKKSYLRRFGWKETCNTPGSYWLWQRDFNQEDEERAKNWRGPTPPKPYGLITAGLDLAVTMTSRELDPDLYGELEPAS